MCSSLRAFGPSRSLWYDLPFLFSIADSLVVEDEGVSSAVRWWTNRRLEGRGKMVSFYWQTRSRSLELLEVNDERRDRGVDRKQGRKEARKWQDSSRLASSGSIKHA